MIGTYPKYKKLGIDWLGQLPIQWPVGKLGVCFVERNEKVSDKVYSALSVTKRGIVPQMKHVAKSDAGDNRKKVCKDDFVINSRSDRKGSSGVSDYEGSVSLISIVLKQKFFYPRFSHYLFRSYDFQEEFYRNGKGIVADLWSTRFTEMKNIFVPLVPMNEQKAIATYLDRETIRIDGLISEKQNFIKLLKEKRKALINNIFKLDDKRKFVKLRYIVDLLPGFAFKSENYSLTPSDIRLLRGVNIGVNITKWKDVVFWPKENFEKLRMYLLERDDIVFGMDRPWISAGARVSIVSDKDLPSLLVQRVARVRARTNIHQKYIYYALASDVFKEYAEADLTGLSVPHISPEQIKDFSVPVLTIKEQISLTGKLDCQTKIIDSTILEVKKSNDLLKERRTALISAAVTGKIDVRNL